MIIQVLSLKFKACPDSRIWGKGQMCVEKYVVLWRLLDDELHLQPGDLHPNFF